MHSSGGHGDILNPHYGAQGSVLVGHVPAESRDELFGKIRRAILVALKIHDVICVRGKVVDGHGPGVPFADFLPVTHPTQWRALYSKIPAGISGSGCEPESWHHYALGKEPPQRH